MAQVAERLATYEDLCDLPLNRVGQIIQGQLIAMSRPAPKYATAALSVDCQLYQPFHRGYGGLGGWRILNKSEIHIQGDIVVPALAG